MNNEHDITWGFPDSRANANTFKSSSTVTSIMADLANASENVNFEVLLSNCWDGGELLLSNADNCWGGELCSKIAR